MANVAKLDENSRPTLTALSSVGDGTIVTLYADPTTHRLLIDLSSAPTFTLLTATGVTDGVNNIYTFASKPTVIVADGASYRENKGWTWNAGTLAATLSVYPVYDVFGEK
jgi:hypothetical protein